MADERQNIIELTFTGVSAPVHWTIRARIGDELGRAWRRRGQDRCGADRRGLRARSSTPPCPAGLPRPRARPSPASTTISKAARRARRTPPTGPIMKSDGRSPVAIVGGGFSGTILAAKLARRGISSVLIDGSGREGRGVAYSTTEPAHLLNVRAERHERLGRRSGPFCPGVRGRRRRPRAVLRSGASSGAMCAKSSIMLSPAATPSDRPATAVGAPRRTGGWTVELDDGTAIARGALVLALGNQEPEPLKALPASAIASSTIRGPGPAREAVERSRASGGSALLIGTGLTMVDLVLSLDAARLPGQDRRTVAPRPNSACACRFRAGTGRPGRIPGGNLHELWRWLRQRSARTGWRAAIDSLRPHSHALWQSLSISDQRRFMRHARPWWDVHRHRIAPQVADTVHRMIAEGQLEVVAGRIVRGLGSRWRSRRRDPPPRQSERIDRALRLCVQLHRAVALLTGPRTRCCDPARQRRRAPRSSGHRP